MGRTIVAVLALLLLAACGGGSQGSTLHSTFRDRNGDGLLDHGAG